MKLGLKSIAILIATLLAVALAACSHSADEVPEMSVDAEQIYVSFEVSVPEMGGTRTPAGAYDPGTGEWENYVDVYYGLRFYFFNSDNSYLGLLDPDDTIIEYVEPGNPGESRSKTYRVRSVVKAELTAVFPTDFKIVALANCPQFPEEDTDGILKLGTTPIPHIDALAQTLTFDMPAGGVSKLDGNWLIPMFGLKEYQNKLVVGGGVTDLSKIHLLRAVAKVEIKAAEGEAPITEVKLHGYNADGLCLPLAVYQESDYVKGSYADDYVKHVSLPGTGNSGSTTVLQMSGEEGIYTIYVPEYRNLISGEKADDRAYLTFKFTGDDDPTEYRIDFCEYPDGKAGAHFDICRNNYYKFTVRRGEFDCSVLVEVFPYTVTVLDPIFGVDFNAAAHQQDLEAIENLEAYYAQTVADIRAHYEVLHPELFTNVVWLELIETIDDRLNVFKEGTRNNWNAYQNKEIAEYPIMVTIEKYMSLATDIQSLDYKVVQIITSQVE